MPETPNTIEHFRRSSHVAPNIVLEMGEAADLHQEALIATAIVLFVFILIINLIVSVLRRRNKQ